MTQYNSDSGYTSPSLNDSAGKQGTTGVARSVMPRPVSQHRPEGRVCLVDTQADLQTLLPELRNADRVALDLETTGLDPRQHRVRLLSLATERGTWLIDCFEVDPRPLFPVLAQKELVIHNALFDLGFLSQMGFEVGEGGRVIDTMLMSQLLTTHQAADKEDA